MSRAEQYAKRALEIGTQIHHRTVIVGAQLNLAILASYRGELDTSLALYREVLSTAQYLEEPRLRASARSNFAQDLLLMGDLDASRENQAKAILEFENLNLPFNLGIAHCGMGFVEVASENFAAAAREFETAGRYATAAQDKRGQGAYLIYKADALALGGGLREAEELYSQSRPAFDRLGLDEALVDEIGARIARLTGRIDEAEALLAKGFEKARPYPLEQASLWLEKSEWLKLVRGKKSQDARLSLQTAASIYEKAGAKTRWRKLTMQISEFLTDK